MQNSGSHTEVRIKALNEQHKTFIQRLQKKWLRTNNHPPKCHVLYELNEEERRRVRRVINSWERYVTPVTERWWKRRGFGIRWPEKSSDPCQIYALKASEA